MLRARDIVDLCDDMGLERSSITVKEGWSHDAQFFLTFGPPAYRQLLEIDPNLGIDALKARLEAARASPLPNVVARLAGLNGQAVVVEADWSGKDKDRMAVRLEPAPEAKPSPAAMPASAKAKRKKVGNVDAN